MTVTLTSQRRTGPDTWRVEWASDLPSPTFYIWRDARFAYATRAASGLFRVTPGIQLVVDVLDTPAPPAAAFPGTMRLEWYSGGAAVARYRVEEWIGGAWVPRQILTNQGQWYYAWTSRFLEDCQSHRFRVVPVGVNSNDGAPVVTDGYLVRRPDIPKAVFAANPDHSLTLSPG